MNEQEKTALSTSLPELLKRIEVTTKFKASIVSSTLWEDDFADRVTDGSLSDEDMLFKVVQKLKKTEDEEGFEKFLGILKTLGLKDAVDVLRTELEKHTGQLENEDQHQMRNDNEEATSTSLLQRRISSESLGSRSSTKPVSPQLQVLKADLQKCLPPGKASKRVGDVAVFDDYSSRVRKFSSKGGPSPGPLPEIDLTRKVHQNYFSFLNPMCCAKLSRELGGRTQLTFDKTHGHEILRQIDGTIKYFEAVVILEPGEITKCGYWFAAECRLRDVLQEVTPWTEFRAQDFGTKEKLSLSQTMEEWERCSASVFIQLFQCGNPSENLTVSEKQEVVARDLSTASGNSERHVLVTDRYHNAVHKFSSGKTSKEPGPVQTPNKEAVALNLPNIAFLPPECCVTLISFYGGQVSLRKNTLTGPIILLDNENKPTYFSCALYASTKDSAIGSYLLLGTASLKDAISSAIGWFPSRAQVPDSPTDLDWGTTVREWYGASKTTRIIVQ